jgi:hypothetical protein
LPPAFAGAASRSTRVAVGVTCWAAPAHPVH